MRNKTATSLLRCPIGSASLASWTLTAAGMTLRTRTTRRRQIRPSFELGQHGADSAASTSATLDVWLTATGLAGLEHPVMAAYSVFAGVLCYLAE
jgi:hypothetical protein